MNRLTNTWRQQKPLTGRENVKPTIGLQVANSHDAASKNTTTKRLGQHAITRTYSVPSSRAASPTPLSNNMVDAKKRKVLSPKQNSRGQDHYNGGELRRSPRFKGRGDDGGNQGSVRRPGIRRRSPRLTQDGSKTPPPVTRVTTPDDIRPNSSFNSSFGTDIDMNEDFLLALEQVEADYQGHHVKGQPQQQVKGQNQHLKGQTQQNVKGQTMGDTSGEGNLNMAKKELPRSKPGFVKFVKHVPESSKENAAEAGNKGLVVNKNAIINKLETCSSEISTNEQRRPPSFSMQSKNVAKNLPTRAAISRCSSTDQNQEMGKHLLQKSTNQLQKLNQERGPQNRSTNLSTKPTANNLSSKTKVSTNHQPRSCNGRTDIITNSTSSVSSSELSNVNKKSSKCVMKETQALNRPVTNQIPNANNTTQFCNSNRGKCNNNNIPTSGRRTSTRHKSMNKFTQDLPRSKVIAAQSGQTNNGSNLRRSPPPVVRTRKLLVDVSPPERTVDSSPLGEVLCEDSQSPGCNDKVMASEKEIPIHKSNEVAPNVRGRRRHGDQQDLVEDIQQEDHVMQQVDLQEDDDMHNSQGFETSHLSPPQNKSQTSSSFNKSLMSPSHTSPDPLALASWGLPDAILQQYHKHKVTHMFPWQGECLRTGNVLDGGNLVYSAPTSAGKTLVAELLVMKRVLETKKKAMIILPFVSVSREKMFYLQDLLQDAGICVDGYMGKQGASGGFGAVDVAICTIERANSLINRLLEQSKLHQLGIIVVDELHMVGDSNRGYLLELLLTKIRYVTSLLKESTKQQNEQDNESESQVVLENPIQIVGMSATLPNLNVLAKWLDADLYTTDYRPVPLTETIKIGPVIYDNTMKKMRDFVPMVEAKGDEEHILALCLETIAEGCSVLVFCPTKNWCEKLSENMAREIARMNGVLPTKGTGFVPASKMAAVTLNRQGLMDTVEQLKRTPSGLDSVLKKTLPYGVAYHHAGLTFDERDIIEGAFRLNSIRILVATSTLSSGVNLPARRVIIRSIMFNRKVLDPLTYKQMAGRAGRKGVDTLGESILVCKLNEKAKATNLLKTELPPVQSCLVRREGDDLSSSMKRAILEVIASGVASSPADVERYASSTLLASSMTSDPENHGNKEEDTTDTSAAISGCVKFLQEREFIRLQKVKSGAATQELYKPSQLGSATLASALTPDEALVVFTELQRARKSFVLENELHIIYQVTPIYSYGFYPDWYQFVCQWENLSTDKRRVAELVGVEERFLVRAARGNIPKHTAKQQHTLAIHNRFYTALILNDLVNEMPVNAVARKYACARGQLQSLQQNAATFAGMVTVFCSKLGWYNLELLLAQFQNRLNFGVQLELCDLVRISLLNAYRARLLYNNGLHCVADVANAKPTDIENLLRIAVPFQSSRRAIDEQQYEAKERQQSRCIWATGRKGLTETEAAGIIVSEAQQILQNDLGIAGVQWGSANHRIIENNENGTTGQQGSSSNGTGGNHRNGASRQQAPVRKETDTSASDVNIQPNGRSEQTGQQRASCSDPIGVGVRTVNNGNTRGMSSSHSMQAAADNVGVTSNPKPVSTHATIGQVSSHVQKQTNDSVKPAQDNNVNRSKKEKLPRHDETLALTNMHQSNSSSHKANTHQSNRCADNQVLAAAETGINHAQRSSTRNSEMSLQGEQNGGGMVSKSNTAVDIGSTRNNIVKKQIVIQADVHAARSQSSKATNINTCEPKSVATSKVPPSVIDVISNDEDLMEGHNDEATIQKRRTNEREPAATSNDSNVRISKDANDVSKNLTSGNGKTNCISNDPHMATSTRVPMKSVTPTMMSKDCSQKQNKDISPELFSVPEEFDLQSVDLGDQAVSCSTPNDVVSVKNSFAALSDIGKNTINNSDKRISETERDKPGRVPALHGDVNAIASPLSTSGHSDFSPSFPSMDSQMLRLVDEVCAQNEAIARTASPDLQRTLTKVMVLSDKSGTNKECEIDVETCQLEKLDTQHTDNGHNLDDAVAMDMSDSFDFPVDEDANMPQNQPLSAGTDVSSRPQIRDGQKKSTFSPVYSQLEADMQLAAQWSDSFSCEENSPDRRVDGGKNNMHDLQISASTKVHGQKLIEVTNLQRIPSKLNTMSKSHRVQNGIRETGEVPCSTSNSVISAQGTSRQLRGGITSKPSKSIFPAKGANGQLQFNRSINPESLIKSRNQSSNCDKSNVLQDQFSPGTMAMLDMFAGEDESNVQYRTVVGAAPSELGRQHSKTIVASVNSSREQTNKDSVHVSTAKSTESCRTMPGKSTRKRKSDEYIAIGEVGSCEGVSPPKRNKGDEAVERRVSPRRLSKERTSEGGEERRTSDGDFVPPTPPKEKPNTPKLLKGTIKKTAKTPQAKGLGVASGSTRSSQRLRTQAQRSQIGKNGKDKVASALVNGTQKARTAKKVLHLSPPEDSQGLFSERDPDESQLNDMNKALDASDLDLRLDMSSDSASSPPVDKPNPTMPQSSPFPQSSPMMPCTDGAFTIIDVCSMRELFETFLEEWRNKVEYSLSVACETYQPPVEGGGIGGKFRKGNSKKCGKADGLLIEDESLLVTGLAVCWGDKDAYFISFQDKPSQDPDESLAQPPLDPDLPISERLQCVKSIVEMDYCWNGSHGNRKKQVIFKSAFDLKQQYKALARSCGMVLGGSVRDPKVAHWLFDPGAKEKNLQGLVTQYLPQETHLLEDIGGGYGVGGLGLTAQNPGSGRLRASTESVLVDMLMMPLNNQLKEMELIKSFVEVEMPSQVTIARMELNGFGFSSDECETQKTIMQAKLTALEEQAYQMAGHGFVLTSPDEIAQVLYAELKLPPNGDPKLANATFRKTLGARGRLKLPKHFSTSKDALEKLKPFHQLPGVILEWRRITGAITKTVFPLQKEKVYHDGLGMDRIYGVCQLHTATGRVAMSDPNLQAIPKDFEIQMPSIIGESPPQGAAPAISCLNAPSPFTRGRGRRGGAAVRNAAGRGGAQQRVQMGQGSQEPLFAVSVRHAFCPFPGGMLIAADYSQLELRILAHLAKDSKLTSILNSGGDVFKQIAAKWKNTTVEEITAEQRQQAKQVCYGMIYGIGAKALGETLGVGEEDGAAFMETFKMQYKGMKTYMSNTIKKCREDGYVTTMMGRRRYLTAIHNTNAGPRNHAERQAVNTTIQGSAADLVKTAMNNIDKRLAEEFPNTRHTHRHKADAILGSSQRKRSRRTQQSPMPPSGAFLVLQLHDELIYEVHQEDMIQVAQLVKMEMETAMKLSVRLPVKVNVGPTWGSMETLDL